MAFGDALRRSWTVRHRANKHEVERALSDLLSACRTICDEHFPAESGYQINVTNLRGPIQGHSISIQRDRFCGIVSLQGSQRPFRDDEASIRLVAAAHHADPGEAWRRGVQWATTAGLTGVGASTVLLWNLPALALLGVLAPLWLASRAVVAVRNSSALQRQALQANPWAQEETSAIARAMAKDLRRWYAALEHFSAQREVVEGRCCLRPFRSLAPAKPLPLAIPTSNIRRVSA